MGEDQRNRGEGRVLSHIEPRQTSSNSEGKDEMNALFGLFELKAGWQSHAITLCSIVEALFTLLFFFGALSVLFS